MEDGDWGTGESWIREQDSATGSGVAEKEEGWLKVPTMVRGSAGVARRGEILGTGLVADSDGRGSSEAWFDSVAEGDGCCHDLSTTSCKRRQDSGRDDSEEAVIVDGLLALRVDSDGRGSTEESGVPAMAFVLESF
jgi:hypothetical protein